MNNIFLVSNLFRILLICIFIVILILHNKKIIKSSLLDLIVEIYDFRNIYNSFLRLIFRISLIFIIIFIMFISLGFFTIVDSIFINSDNMKSDILVNKYENDISTKDFRNLEYIGGTNVYDSDNHLKRWIDLYLDLDTKEVLRNSNGSNYITAGLPIIGTDKMLVQKSRQTKKGFQEYVLQWTGSILYDLEVKDLKNNKYGNTKCVENYNKPIDILCDVNWNSNKEYKDNQKYMICTISEVSTNSINNILLESNGKLDKLSYIYSILRNCFGFISNDFYSLGFNQNNFNRIEIKDIEIGDIGIKGNNNEISQIGICIGFDDRCNPIFSLCTDINSGLSEYLHHKLKLQEVGIIGYNILHVEPKSFFDRFIWQNKVFDKYYKTSLPFEDNNTISKNIYKIHDTVYKISDKDIDKYNNQVLSQIVFKGKEYYIDMSKRIYQERIKRITDRENSAVSLCAQYDVNIKQYENNDINDFNLVYDTNTFEYKNYINRYDNDKIEYYKNKYKRLSKEKKQQRYENDKEVFLDRLNDDINDLKDLSLDEIFKYYQDKGTLIMSEGKELIEEFYNSIHD